MPKEKKEEKKIESPLDLKKREYYSTKIWQAFKLFV